MNVIKKELRAVAERYGDERRTEIVRAGEVVEAAAKEEIIAEDALVTYSRAGLLRRVYPPRARRQAAEEGAEDAPLYRFDTQTDHTLYFFTDRGNCYPLSVAALPEMKPKDRGALLSGVLAGLEENETPVNILCLKPSEQMCIRDRCASTSPRSARSAWATRWPAATATRALYPAFCRRKICRSWRTARRWTLC